jgi:hypothetical protein
MQNNLFGLPRIIVLRSLIVAAVIAACVIIAFLTPLAINGNKSVLLIIALCFLIGPLFIYFKHPSWGVILLIPVSLIVPFSVGTGSESSINATMLLLAFLFGMWIIELLISKGKMTFLRSRCILASIVFMLLAVISFGFGQLPWFSIPAAPIRAQIGGLSIFLLSIAALLLVAHRITDIRELEWMTWIFIILGAVYVVTSFIPSLSAALDRFFYYGVSGSLFWVWIIALSFSQALLNNKLPLHWRLACAFVVIITVYQRLSPGRIGWSSGWLPGLIVFASISWLAKPRWRPYFIGIGLPLLLFNIQNISGILFAGDNSYSLLTREAAWKILGEIISVNPVLGLGFANYYWFTPLFPILGYAVSFNSHNNFIDIIAQMGFVGLICFFWITYELSALSWRLKKLAPEGFAKAYVYGAMGGLIGTIAACMLGDWFLPFVYNIGFKGFRASIFGWIFLGGVIALEQISAHKRLE